jgi:hypothetical protein
MSSWELVIIDKFNSLCSDEGSLRIDHQISKELRNFSLFYKRVSTLVNWLEAIAPIACLPIAHWYVFLGLWL